MTIYQENIYAKNIYQHKYQDTSIRMTGFFKLMGKWKGSFMKLIYHDLITFVFFYALLSLLYRCVFINNPYHKEMFELICIYAGRFMSYIPLAFLIGFYVQQVSSKLFSIIFSSTLSSRLSPDGGILSQSSPTLTRLLSS